MKEDLAAYRRGWKRAEDERDELASRLKASQEIIAHLRAQMTGASDVQQHSTHGTSASSEHSFNGTISKTTADGRVSPTVPLSIYGKSPISPSTPSREVQRNDATSPPGSFRMLQHGSEIHNVLHDASPRTLNPKLLISQQNPKACIYFYVLGRCRHESKCNKAHDYILNPAQTAELRAYAKTQPCKAVRDGKGCLHGEACCFGHKCPRLQECARLQEGKCWFKSPLAHIED
ncbi:uncharacterized protein STEHIDRAFT_120687 [Stereum hirsutum FP-91666 SS1]|uniref:uncharacterized protein n=1 Tax=Stereum hirsutum (strain FP-91666) TaxID=721885 RepID=UPI000440F59E|nr:uncharacterized protein STEHIDRAFT_120687 [Stereum hirsutum FP-91666 SS1]EIM88540.1 hypothetical protein STEHIDRAFT_120687 [Stereum hirsutum FP-91666 SS1]